MFCSTLRASIIALCFNHKDYLDAALSSLEGLPESEVEIIVCDDASTDGSRGLLEQWRHRKPEWKFLLNDTNAGNCRTFNAALAHCSGAWVLDFSTDDILRTEAFLPWLEFAESQPETGFIYAGASIFSKNKENASPFQAPGKIVQYPEGNIFPFLFGPTFICPPAVLFHAEKLSESGGYHPLLAYEDWDIWLRLAVKYPVRRFSGDVIFYRKHKGSLSASLFLKRNTAILDSTLLILNEAGKWPDMRLVDNAVFARFVRYHLRLCFFLQLPNLARAFLQILKSRGMACFYDFLMAIASNKLPFLYPVFRWLKSRKGT